MSLNSVKLPGGGTIRSAYLNDVLSPAGIRSIVGDAVATILAAKLKFDAIAFRGMSGALVAPLVGVALGKPLILVRKGESTHSNSIVEGFDLPGQSVRSRKFRYIILDDFIDTGETIQSIIESLKEERPQAVLVGVVAWKRGGGLLALRPDPATNGSSIFERITRYRLDRLGEVYNPEPADIPVYCGREP